LNWIFWGRVVWRVQSVIHTLTITTCVCVCVSVSVCAYFLVSKPKNYDHLPSVLPLPDVHYVCERTNRQTDREMENDW
jgi:hypothetical protein